MHWFKTTSKERSANCIDEIEKKNQLPKSLRRPSTERWQDRQLTVQNPKFIIKLIDIVANSIVKLCHIKYEISLVVEMLRHVWRVVSFQFVVRGINGRNLHLCVMYETSALELF